ncbi:hypothetical protein ACIBAG_43110 [Streptomyces sp. NPDC051243]|uniref:hypothetical protein n=1 Tax=Streptomyces sp. NPDC051243 TaxID=3365646 RepID=UPI0037B561DB
MTWSAALPFAAVRIVRMVAGRRALQVALLVGGLFVLGFLCGERAYAADVVSAGTSTSASSVSAPSAPAGVVPSASDGSEGDEVGTVARSTVELPAGEPARTGEQAPAILGPHAPAIPGPHAPAGPAPDALPEPAPHHDEPSVPANPPTTPQADPATPRHSAPVVPAPHSADGTADELVGPVTEHLVQGVADRVVEPVGKVVETVTEGLTEGLAEAAPPLASLPSLPVLPVLPTMPESPGWPGLPGFEVPGVPGVPGFPELPGLPTAPAVPAQTLPAPVTTTPQPGSEAPASGDRRDDKGRTGGTAAHVTYGPWAGSGAAVPKASTGTGDAHRTASAGYAPVHQAPVDHPGAVGGSRSAGDNNNPRHGDAHAVSLSQRAPLRLVPGAAARADADEILDRHGDIPVSPA